MAVRKPTTSRKAKIAATKQFKPKSGKKVLRKALQSKAAQKLKRGIGPALGAMTLYDAYHFGMPAISKSHAKSWGKEYKLEDDLTPENYRKFWKDFHIEVKKDTAKRTKEQRKSIVPTLSRSLKYQKKRKEGGRVGRPIGVGAALRGYGRAMKNG